MKVEIEISSNGEKDLPTAEKETEKPASKEEVLAKLRALFAANGPGAQMSPEALKEEIDSLIEKLNGEED
jgi:hypothetical protein